MRGLILMTALPPTEGHLSLIRFAVAYLSAEGGGSLDVMMCVLPDEPPGRAEHYECLASIISGNAITLEGAPVDVRLSLQFSNDPQGPRDDNDDAFWAHWVGTVTRQTRGSAPDFVFSSEEYGARLALNLGATHIPFDASRDVCQARATSVRSDIVGRFGSIVRPLRDRLRRRICIFGQESTGKTTLTRALSAELGCVSSPEWARPYLEAQATPEPQERMARIARGQRAQELAADQLAADRGCPFVFLDTDLLSTIGYNEHWRGHGSPRGFHEVRTLLERLYQPADLYLVMPDTIPFEPDPLRYGGTQRETTRDYWISMLASRRLPHLVMESESPGDLASEAIGASVGCLEERAGFARYDRRRI